MGIDPVAEAMADASRRASAKPSRGGLNNVLFLQASLETFELDALADIVTVNYPWGSLLRAVALPDPALLRRLAVTLKPGGSVTALINLTPLRDPAQAAKLGLPNSALLHDHGRLAAVYAETGLDQVSVRASKEPAPRTRWGQQLAYAGREILCVTARRTLA